MEFKLGDLSVAYEKFWEAEKNSGEILERVSTSDWDGFVDCGSISRLSKSAFEIDLIASRLEKLLEIVLKSQEKHNKSMVPISAKLAKGLSTLPDDILSVIFLHAVRLEEGRGGRQAVRLSLVSRTFRRIALEEPNLWTSLSSKASKGELESLLSCSGAVSDLHALFQVTREPFNADTCDAERFLKIVRKTASRWKILSFLMEPTQETRKKSHSYGYYVDNVLDAFELVHTLNFPRLQELTLVGNDAGRVRNKLRWIAPSLRFLKCFGYTPAPSTTFSSVTSFYFKQSIDDHPPVNIEPIELLLKLLPSMPLLSHLELEWDRVDLRWASQRQINQFSVPQTACSSITSFHFHLSQRSAFKVPSEKNGLWHISLFLNTLRMPNLDDVTVSIDLRNIGDSKSSPILRTSLLEDLSRSLIPDYLATPTARLSTLTYNISCSDDQVGLDTKLTSSSPSPFETTFTIPLCRVPTISKLTISSCARIRFACEDDQRGKSSKSALRDVQLFECENMDVEELRAVTQSLMDVGAWDAIERFSVEYTPSLEYPAALEIVGKERLRAPGYSHLSNPNYRRATD